MCIWSRDWNFHILSNFSKANLVPSRLPLPVVFPKMISCSSCSGTMASLVDNLISAGLTPEGANSIFGIARMPLFQSGNYPLAQIQRNSLCVVDTSSSLPWRLNGSSSKLLRHWGATLTRMEELQVSATVPKQQC